MKKKSGMMAFSVLALSLLPMSTGATAATIPGLMKQFPGLSAETAELTVTIPSFTMALLIVISSFLVKRFGTRKMVLGGTALTAVGAIISMMAPNVATLLFARALLGAGIGMFNTLCISLIDLLYSGPTRERLLGFQNTFQGLGAAGGALIVGIILSVANWHMAFAFYLIVVVLLVLYALFVPEVRYDHVDAQHDGGPTKLTTAAKSQFAYYWVVLFIVMVFYMTVNVKIPSYILENHFGSLSVGSSAVVIMSVGTIIGGMIYGNVYHLFKRYTLFLAVLIEAVSVFAISAANSAIGCVAGAFGVGFAFGLFIPFIFSKGLSFVPKRMGNDATTVLMLATNGANFLCPYVSKLINIGGTDHSLFMISGVIATVIAVIELIKLMTHNHLRTASENA